MARGVGQHKTQAEKAQEQYEKQLEKVEKLLQKRSDMMNVVVELNLTIQEEQKMLDYYSKHPLVNVTKTLPLDYLDEVEKEHQPKHAKDNKKYQALGIGGRYVEGDQ